MHGLPWSQKFSCFLSAWEAEVFLAASRLEFAASNSRLWFFHLVQRKINENLWDQDMHGSGKVPICV